MALTVITAFDEFLCNSVNLDADQTTIARKSRNWLLGKIEGFPNSQIYFPKLYDNKSINFGSFARRTKKSPLDDIDMMICLSAEGASYDDSLAFPSQVKYY